MVGSCAPLERGIDVDAQNQHVVGNELDQLLVELGLRRNTMEGIPMAVQKVESTTEVSLVEGWGGGTLEGNGNVV